MAALGFRPVRRHAGQFVRQRWLPAGGYGNRLSDGSCVPVLEVSERLLPQALTVPRNAGCPPTQRLRQPARYQLWVGARACGWKAEAPMAVESSPAWEGVGPAGDQQDAAARQAAGIRRDSHGKPR